MRHSRTETITTGTSSAAKIPITAAKRATCGRVIGHRAQQQVSAVEQPQDEVVVRRESQVHQVPQIGLAHIDPVISTSVQKTIPISAAA